jgi:hypothetical protein
MYCIQLHINLHVYPKIVYNLTDLSCGEELAAHRANLIFSYITKIYSINSDWRETRKVLTILLLASNGNRFIDSATTQVNCYLSLRFWASPTNSSVPCDNTYNTCLSGYIFLVDSLLCEAYWFFL